ncbi:hypothetical protein LTR86_003633 [Recurvomyces mirabilis]|nr:hypothetical protein LTR86_003633 [Recurvomyces mirabilis]
MVVNETLVSDVEILEMEGDGDGVERLVEGTRLVLNKLVPDRLVLGAVAVMVDSGVELVKVPPMDVLGTVPLEAETTGDERLVEGGGNEVEDTDSERLGDDAGTVILVTVFDSEVDKPDVARLIELPDMLLIAMLMLELGTEIEGLVLNEPAEAPEAVESTESEFIPKVVLGTLRLLAELDVLRSDVARYVDPKGVSTAEKVVEEPELLKLMLVKVPDTVLKLTLGEVVTRLGSDVLGYVLGVKTGDETGASVVVGPNVVELNVSDVKLTLEDIVGVLYIGTSDVEAE